MHKSDTQIVSKMYKELALINNKGQEKKKARLLQKLAKRRHTNGQQGHKKVVNIICYLRNINKIHQILFQS